MKKVSELDYTRAQQGDAETRQGFLDAIDLGSIGPLVMKVLYIDGEYRFDSNVDMVCLGSSLPSIDQNGQKIFHSLIGVFKKAFGVSHNVFRSALIDHEGYHVIQHNRFPEAVRRIEELINNSPEEDKNGLNSVFEIPAYLHQRNHAGQIITDPSFARYLGGLPSMVNHFLLAERKSPGSLMPLLRSITDEAEFTQINEVIENHRRLMTGGKA